MNNDELLALIKQIREENSSLTKRDLELLLISELVANGEYGFLQVDLDSLESWILS